MRKVIISVMLLAFVAACGASARRDTLRGNIVALDVARDTTLKISKEHEAAIIEHATSKDEARVRLDEWRAVVDSMMVALEDGYRITYSAAILDDAKSASEAGAAVAKALALLKELKKP